MKRFFILSALFTLLSLNIQAQETITVMQYNLLYYGNYNSGFADCYETNNNTQHKDECIRTILNYVNPDILTVCEFGKTQQLQDDFLKHNLNISDSYWKSDNIINYANEDIINHIFYDSRKMGLKKHVALLTSPRDTDVYELYMKTSSLLSGDTIKLVCIVTHPKAGPSYEASRRATMQTAMDYVRQHYANDNVLIMGDFNMYRASESGYQLLTKTYSDASVLFVDPLANQGGVGQWSGREEFAPFHTQSTRRYSDECFSSGGLDDRFDFILMSDEIYMGFNKIKYVNNSYKAVGNDGNHFDKSINQNGNSAVPAAVAEALFDSSDHLPVTLKLNLYGGWEVDELASTEWSVYPNPTNDILNVDIANSATYQITNIMGQMVMTGRIGGETHQINILGLSSGLYFININGVISKFVKTSSRF